MESLAERLDQLISFHTKEEGHPQRGENVSYDGVHRKVYNLTKEHKETELLELA